MSKLAQLSYFGRSAVQGIRHAPFLHTVAVSTLAIALFALGLARGGGKILDGLLNSLGGQVQLTIYLQPEVPAASVSALSAEVARATEGQVQFVSPEAALGRLAKELGPLGDALVDLPGNPLPPSLEVSVPPSKRQPERLSQLATTLRANAAVKGVDYGEEAIARLTAIVRALRWAGWVAFLIVTLATILIVSATLQLAIYARREEIEIQKLVGATDRFVKAPFLLEGLFQGVMGASVALFALSVFSWWASERLVGLFSFLLLPGVQTRLVDSHLAFELWGVGAVLGLGGSFLAVRRFSRG